MEQTAEKEGGVFGNGMKTSRGSLLSSGIPLLLSSLWIVSCMRGGRRKQRDCGLVPVASFFDAVVGNMLRF